MVLKKAVLKITQRPSNLMNFWTATTGSKRAARVSIPADIF